MLWYANSYKYIYISIVMIKFVYMSPTHDKTFVCFRNQICKKIDDTPFPTTNISRSLEYTNREITIQWNHKAIVAISCRAQLSPLKRQTYQNDNEVNATNDNGFDKDAEIELFPWYSSYWH